MFPNLYIALNIYFTSPSKNCSAESKLGKIKNKYRTFIKQENAQLHYGIWKLCFANNKQYYD